MFGGFSADRTVEPLKEPLLHGVPWPFSLVRRTGTDKGNHWWFLGVAGRGQDGIQVGGLGILFKGIWLGGGDWCLSLLFWGGSDF